MFTITYSPSKGTVSGDEIIVTGLRILDIPPGNRGDIPCVRTNTAVSGGGTSVGAGGGMIPIDQIVSITVDGQIEP